MDDYSKVNWQDSPNESTPVNATNLNKMDTGIMNNQTNIKSALEKITKNITDIASAIARIATLEGKINKTVGTSAKPIWLNNGVFTASTSSIGSTSQPVYMNNGQIYACTKYSDATVNKAASADYATSAGSATSATNATNATYATSAGSATSCTTSRLTEGFTSTSMESVMVSISPNNIGAGGEVEMDTNISVRSGRIPIGIVGSGISNGYNFSANVVTNPTGSQYIVRSRIRNNNSSTGKPAMCFVMVLYAKLNIVD